MTVGFFSIPSPPFGSIPESSCLKPRVFSGDSLEGPATLCRRRNYAIISPGLLFPCSVLSWKVSPDPTAHRKAIRADHQWRVSHKAAPVINDDDPLMPLARMHWMVSQTPRFSDAEIRSALITSRTETLSSGTSWR
jgi:hypothetical protein